MWRISMWRDWSSFHPEILLSHHCHPWISASEWSINSFLFLHGLCVWTHGVLSWVQSILSLHLLYYSSCLKLLHQPCCFLSLRILFQAVGNSTGKDWSWWPTLGEYFREESYISSFILGFKHNWYLKSSNPWQYRAIPIIFSYELLVDVRENQAVWNLVDQYHTIIYFAFDLAC